MIDDVRQIENLLSSYAERLDASDFAGVGELFEYGRIMALPDASAEATFSGAETVCGLYQ